MNLSKNYDVFVREQEGCILHPYLDQAGVATIGIGTTRYPSGVHVTMNDQPITQEQANQYLEFDSKSVADAVNAYVKSSINQNQFDALADFSYNVGTGALHGSTLLKLVNINPTDPAIRNAFGMWSKIHKDGKLIFSQDLATRRKKEADLFFSAL
jgi:lysozyme